MEETLLEAERDTDSMLADNAAKKLIRAGGATLRGKPANVDE
jgi:hypothetical protein